MVNVTLFIPNIFTYNYSQTVGFIISLIERNKYGKIINISVKNTKYENTYNAILEIIWNNTTASVQDILHRLQEGNFVKLFYGENKFWKMYIYRNKNITENRSTQIQTEPKIDNSINDRTMRIVKSSNVLYEEYDHSDNESD